MQTKADMRLSRKAGIVGVLRISMCVMVDPLCHAEHGSGSRQYGIQCMQHLNPRVDMLLSQASAKVLVDSEADRFAGGSRVQRVRAACGLHSQRKLHAGQAKAGGAQYLQVEGSGRPKS